MEMLTVMRCVEERLSKMYNLLCEGPLCAGGLGASPTCPVTNLALQSSPVHKSIITQQTVSASGFVQ